MVAEAKHDRIVVDLQGGASSRHLRELAAFVRFCVARIERDVGIQERWAVRIAQSSVGGFTSWIAVHHHGLRVSSSGDGVDGVLATWHAMGRVEQLLRERCAVVTPHVDRE